MLSLTTFDPDATAAIAGLLKVQHARLAQLDRLTSARSTSARNYDSAIKTLGAHLTFIGAPLPTKSVLESWRDDMLSGRAPLVREITKDGVTRVVTTFEPLAVSSVNVKLSAARKLLRAVADDVTDVHIKLVLNDWAKVEDAKATQQADKIEADYGRRLTHSSLEKLIRSIDTRTLKGLRDRALVAVMVGAGLRVSEAVKLTVADVFLTQNASGQRGIRVRQGKHNKSRIVVLNGWNSWVIQAVQAYTDALELTPLTHAGAPIFRGVQVAKRTKKGDRSRQAAAYTSAETALTARNAERAVNAYKAEYQGEMVVINCHDLRRTYAKLCKQSGMSWEALRDNMGHSSVTITEQYVGRDVDWSERVPNWTIKL